MQLRQRQSREGDDCGHSEGDQPRPEGRVVYPRVPAQPVEAGGAGHVKQPTLEVPPRVGVIGGSINAQFSTCRWQWIADIKYTPDNMKIMRSFKLFTVLKYATIFLHVNVEY